jgi:propanol-preferring alcohol dehydrogenase
MRALRLMQWQADPVLVEVDDPVAGPGQVVVRVGGAGACQSDVHTIRYTAAEAPPWKLPFTLGHENAGWVHALGAGVTGWELGQPVAVLGAWGCGRCNRCRLGDELYCENPSAAPTTGGSGGLGADGGMADLFLVPSGRFLVALPDSLTPALAAPLTDAGLTPYHAIRRSWPKLIPGSTAVVIGVGGLGHLGIQIIKATTGARIVAVDSRAEALEHARELGADLTVEAGESARAAIVAYTGGLGAQVVLDFVGNEATMALGAGVVRPLGDLTVVGLGGGMLPVSFSTVPYVVSIQLDCGGTRSEFNELLALAAQGAIRPEVTTFPLEAAVDVLTRLERAEVRGRAVLVPNEC